MRRRHPLPRIWLMTDERLGEGLLAAVNRLPRGAGIVFRHYATPPAERRALFAQVRAIARRRGCLIVLAGDPRLARAWRADGWHGHGRQCFGLRTAPVHDVAERVAAERAGADLLFVSPVHTTRSHPGARPLGRVRALSVAGRSRTRTVALGGMNAISAAPLLRAGFHGWAAIDAWSGEPGR